MKGKKYFAAPKRVAAVEEKRIAAMMCDEL